MSDITHKMAVILADTYALYLKTQNYHWHVKGPNFKTLHELFEAQYLELAQAVDDIAERILTMGHAAPATFKEFLELKKIKDGDASISSDEMVKELALDHTQILEDLNKAIVAAQENNDEGSIVLLSERIAHHEKIRWMLGASRLQ